MIKIKKRIISNTEKAYIIAEIGLSHNGILKNAIKMIDASSKAGADAVKFQMHFAEYESSVHEKFRSGFKFKDKSRYDYWKRTSFTLKEWNILKKYSIKKKIIFLCSPFSIESVDYLIKLNLDAWKIASGEINNFLMLDHIIKKSNKPIILSTGLSDEKEIKKTLHFIKSKLYKKKLKNELSLLQCNSQYPTHVSKVGHKIIQILKKKFKLITGLSDHSGNINSLISGITLGAKILEFHVTFDKKFFGPDVNSSITFEELNFLSKFNNDYHEILNSNFKTKKISKNLLKMKKLFHKSLALRNNKKKDDKILLKDLIALKPNIGISVDKYNSVIGKKLTRNLKKNTFLKKELIK